MIELLSNNWELLAYLGAMATAVAAFVNQSLSIRKTALEIERLKDALAVRDRVIQRATITDMNREIALQDASLKRQKLWAIDGAGLAALVVLITAKLPLLIYILAGSFVLLVGLTIIGMRFDNTRSSLLERLKLEVTLD